MVTSTPTKCGWSAASLNEPTIVLLHALLSHANTLPCTPPSGEQASQDRLTPGVEAMELEASPERSSRTVNGAFMFLPLLRRTTNQPECALACAGSGRRLTEWSGRRLAWKGGGRVAAGRKAHH
jgi:hypothetical protein